MSFVQSPRLSDMVANRRNVANEDPGGTSPRQVFFEDNAIAQVVKRLIENEKYFAVSANVINNPALSWVHYSMGLYYPYWPVSPPPALAFALTMASFLFHNGQPRCV